MTLGVLGDKTMNDYDRLFDSLEYEEIEFEEMATVSGLGCGALAKKFANHMDYPCKVYNNYTDVIIASDRLIVFWNGINQHTLKIITEAVARDTTTIIISNSVTN